MSARADRGFTLIETTVSMLVLAVGLLGTLLVYDGARGLTGVSERRTTLAHRAEAELERVRALGWSAMALDAVPARGAAPAGMTTADTPPRLRPDRRDASVVEQLVVDAATGRVPAGPRPWSDGRESGTLQTWVSVRPDPACGASCSTAGSTRRLTVAVTDDDDPATGRAPLVSSVVVSDPAAAPAGSMLDGTRHPLQDPSIACATAAGATVPCTQSISDGSATSWFLYDTPASQDLWSLISGDHPVDRTVAPVGSCLLALLSSCPTPDLMGDEPPPSPATAPPLIDRSSDLPGSAGTGGRVLERDTGECADPPPASNRRSHRWVTPAQPDGLELTGDGGLTLYSRTTSGVEARVTLCLQLSVALGPVRELLGLPPVVLGTVSYTLAAWPAVMTPVSFSFDLPGSSLLVAAGRRLAARVWLAASSASDVVVAYDHPTLQSALQVNVR